MSFPRYERYKDSGVEWLGEVPEHWDIYRSRRLFAQRKERVRDSDEQLTASQKHGIVTQAAFMQTEGRAVVRVIHGAEILKHVEPDDFVISMRSFQGGLEWSGIRGCISSAYVMLAPSGSVYPGFFRYLFKSDLYIQALQTTSNLVRDGQAMRYENFTLIDLPLPPMREQQEIMRFLDCEVQKLEELIDEQMKLIEMLKEKRQALISHAVTRGIDSSAAIVESIALFAEHLPRQWQVFRLKRLASKIGSGKTPRGGAEVYSSEGVTFLRSQNVHDEGLKLDDVVFIDKSIDDEMASTRVQPSDILLNITGASIGRTCIVPSDLGRANVSQHVCIIRPKQPEQASFLSHALKATYVKAQMAYVQNGAARDGLNFEQIANLYVGMPSTLEECLAIAEYVDRVTVSISDLIARSDEAISILRERRNALISSAVTGKIDVRVYMAEPTMSVTQYSSGFAHQLLAAEILDRCNSQRMGRIKLQKLIHLCEYHGQLSEVQGDYSRKAAGPFDAKAMAGISKNLKKQKWFEEVKEGERYVYRSLQRRGEHKKYLAHWRAEMPRIDEVLSLLGNFKTRECEIVSTLYAAWNDLLIDGGSTDDDAILHEASSAERWHKSKEQIAPERWKKALQWMKDKCLVPVGYGKHTRHTAGQSGATTEEAHEPA